MRTTARIGACLLAVATTGAGLVPAAHAGERAEQVLPPPTIAPATKATHTTQGDRTVTLLTGDRLRISGDGRTAARLPSPGRDDVALISRTVDGHLEVVPADAVRLVNSGKLDRRLFDVTQLLEYGYDDRSGALPLIVSYTDNAAGRAARRANDVADDATVVHDLPSVDGSAIEVKGTDAADLWDTLTDGKKRDLRTLSTGFHKVWLDGLATPSLDASAALVGAPQAWAAGLTGKAVPVGVIDSGVDETHPDLAGKVVARDFTEDGDTVDRVGHGTHVASTIAGTGAASAGRFKGVAPDATVYSAKVCVWVPALKDAVCPESAILAGMQWIARDERLRVANISLGGMDRPGLDVLETAVDTLTAEFGTLFVVSAGNGGPIGSPASAAAALTVGATDKRDFAAPFSSRGPGTFDGALKPDIAAPGVDIVAAYAAGTPITPTAPDSRYAALQGTSMAAPHVSGAAAILAQQHPTWKAAELKAALMNNAVTKPWYAPELVGAGRLDVAKAVAAPVLAQPGSLYFGTFRAPHDNHAPSTKKITYHNSGTTPLTLAVAVNATAPPGIFTLSASSVTIAPGGDAEVAVTANPAVSTGNQRFNGTVLANGHGVQIRTPIAVQKDKETVELTVTYRNRAGQLSDDFDSSLYALNGDGMSGVFDPSGVAKVRVAKGTYSMDAKILDKDGSMTLLVQPKLVINGDTAVEFDARTAKPITVTMPRPGLRQVFANVSFTFPTPKGSFIGDALTDTSFDKMYVGQVGGDLEGLLSDLAGAWVRPAADGRSRNSPEIYNLAWYEKNRFFSGFTRQVHQGQLATVENTFAANAPGRDGAKYTAYRHPSTQRLTGWLIGTGFDLPLHRTEYYNTDDNVQFSDQVLEGEPGSPNSHYGYFKAFRSFQPGSFTSESWNRAVISPAFTTSIDGFKRGIFRIGNAIDMAVGFFADAAGHDGFAANTKHTITATLGSGQMGTINSDRATLTAPAGDTGFTLTHSITRDIELSPLSSQVDVRWTFRSAEVPAGTTQPLPVSVIRFAPRVDDTNTSVLGPVEMLPFTVAHQPGSTAGVTTTASVEASFDGGKTWVPAQVFGTGDSREALVKRPAGHGLISLKASASDAAGNTVQQTILNAYRY
jgi:subtilisin family serine protease